MISLPQWHGRATRRRPHPVPGVHRLARQPRVQLAPNQLGAVQLLPVISHPRWLSGQPYKAHSIELAFPPYLLSLRKDLIMDRKITCL